MAGYVGLFDFYVTVPNVASGDYPTAISENGTPDPQTMYLTVGQ
ncbi:MAG TPA: hypothetical protein VMB03_22085 [Bryobacteraceae bacterium]|nr:hypothetical protein [Bryobacteraceae bacterium]